MNDFEKINSIVKDLSRRAKAIKGTAWVAVSCSPSWDGWYATSHMMDITTESYPDPFLALEEIEKRIRAIENADANLARTLGLEAAE